MIEDVGKNEEIGFRRCSCGVLAVVVGMVIEVEEES